MNTSGDGFWIDLRGYVPPTRNQMKGSHWSVAHKERRRAAICLLETLRLAAAQESLSESAAGAPLIGTATPSKSFKTCSSTLASWMMTHGMSFTAPSSQKRFTRKRKKGQALKSSGRER